MPGPDIPPLSPSVARDAGTMGDGSDRRITFYSWRGGPLPPQQVSVPQPAPGDPGAPDDSP